MVTGGPYGNEDLNKNLILDPADFEDTSTTCGSDPCCGDGALTPPSSAAGSAPGTVETDEYGVGNFELVYLKSSAVWIDDAITASTIVLGTETTTTLEFSLPYLEADGRYLPDSPYGLGSLTIFASEDIDNGHIVPAGEISVPVGGDQTFTIIPDAGYEIAWLVIDDVYTPPAGTYTFYEVMEIHTISAIFAPEPGP